MEFTFSHGLNLVWEDILTVETYICTGHKTSSLGIKRERSKQEKIYTYSAGEAAGLLAPSDILPNNPSWLI